MSPSDMVTFDRFLFAFTIGSHILLVCSSIILIVVISVSEFLSIRKHDRYYGSLAQRLSKVFVISFGVGTASGIVMAVELVALFPAFMTFVSQTGVIALLYAEVFAFFLEILALVMYVYYGRSYKNPYTHWVLSLLIVAGTLLSALFITAVNAWMNTPNGFDVQTYLTSGIITQVNPWAPFMTASTLSELAHVLFTTLFAGAMIFGAYFSYRYIRHSADPEEKAVLSRGLKILGAVSIATIILSGLTGSNEVVSLLVNQPLKYAAIDANTIPGTNLPERLFGTISSTGQFSGGIVIPGMQALLASFESGITQLPGLSQFPSSTWPPLYIHTTFNVMIVAGMILGLFFLAYCFQWILQRKKPYESRYFLYSWIPLAFLGFIVYEIGWATDEVGREPWIIYNVMKVADAANQSTSVFIPGVLIIAFYLVIVPATFYFFARVFAANPREGEKEEELEAGEIPVAGEDINY